MPTRHFVVLCVLGILTGCSPQKQESSAPTTPSAPSPAQPATPAKKVIADGEFLHQIRYSDNPDLIAQLLNDGANPNAKNGEGLTALSMALLNVGPGSPNYPQVLKIVDLLLEHGADVNARLSDKSTVLFMSVESGDQELTKKFLKKGAEVNAQANRGRTPLIAAAQSGSLEMVRLLIENGADPNVRMTNGENAWHVAHVFVGGSQVQVAAYLAPRTNRQDIEALLRKDDYSDGAIKKYFERLDKAPR